MHLGNLSDVDQTIARWVGRLSVLILGGLMATGIWQFLFHEATPSWARYQLGQEFRRQAPTATGIADAHAAFADLAGILALFVLAWLSARVVFRVSRYGFAALLLVVASLITGSLVRFNAVYTDETVSIDTDGYWQFFSGSVDGAITDRYELGSAVFAFWTTVHIASIPVLVAATWFTLRRAEARRVAAKGERPEWLDRYAARRDAEGF